MNKDIAVQIFSGGFNGKSVCFDVVRAKLEEISDMNISKVIMGWSIDRKLYEKTAEYLSSRNIEFFLWLPVFSEIGVLQQSEPIVNIDGKHIPSYIGHEQEDFTFYCPNNDSNIINVIDVFERYYKDISFNGIFLDKIRYPSFANTLQGITSCCCPLCLAKYKKVGFDLFELKNEVARINQLCTPFGITNYHSGKYEFINEIWNKLFFIKTESITTSVKKIANYMKSKGYKVGLDVFAPFLSQFVGQDIIALSAYADFIKPMMYGMTNAPAGIPFEINALMTETHSDSINKKRNFYEILGLQYNKRMFDIDFICNDVKSLAHNSKCPVNVGVEINRINGIAEVYPAYINEILTNISQLDISGFVLSWDILNAPLENLGEAKAVIAKF